MPVITKARRLSLNNHIADYVKTDKTFMNGVKQGVADCKAGRKQIWAEAKRELGIDTSMNIFLIRCLPYTCRHV